MKNTILDQAKERVITAILKELSRLCDKGYSESLSYYNNLKTSIIYLVDLNDDIRYLQDRIKSGEASERELIGFIKNIKTAGYDTTYLKDVFDGLCLVDEVLNVIAWALPQLQTIDLIKYNQNRENEADNKHD
jgi:hypothetical protein|nr:MAG TPA: hypothetical protein [Caudoviricetes sp.]